MLVKSRTQQNLTGAGRLLIMDILPSGYQMVIFLQNRSPEGKVDLAAGFVLVC
jgi:hypothetical protein